MSSHLTPAEILRVKALCQDLVQQLAPTNVEKYIAKTTLIFDVHTTRLLELYGPLSRFTIVQLAQEVVETDLTDTNRPVLDMLYYKVLALPRPDRTSTDRTSPDQPPIGPGYFHSISHYYPEIERAKALALVPVALLAYLQTLPDPFLRAAALAAALPWLDLAGIDPATAKGLVQLVANPYHADVFRLLAQRLAKDEKQDPAVADALARNEELQYAVGTL